MQRSKFPYTARSSAKVIRHAVSIDERRAKFRSDLISEGTPHQKHERHHHRHHHIHRKQPNDEKDAEKQDDRTNGITRRETAPKLAPDRFRRPSQSQSRSRPPPERTNRFNSGLSAQDEEGHLMPSLSFPIESHMRSMSSVRIADGDASSINTDTSQMSGAPPRPLDEDDDEDEAAEQDVEELWFPGCHADLGGGWPLSANEESALSHNPLVWITTEAQRAGLDFDREQMIQLKCCDDKASEWPDSPETTQAHDANIPGVQVTSSSEPNIFARSRSDTAATGWAPGLQPEKPKQSEFHRILHAAATKGMLHDCLEFNNGLTRMSVLSWRIMEYLPFRRMDLKPDGSWEAISFP